MGMRRSSHVMIGRDRLLADLEEAVAGRLEKPVVLVGGESGVGKSRLVAELAVRARAAGSVVVQGSCVDMGADHLPYAPFVDALGRYIEASGGLASDTLGDSLRDLGGLLPDLPLPEGATAPSRGRLYESVRRVLDDAPLPTVLVIEDLHWADRSSLELLTYLASRLRFGRTSLVVTFRTDELSAGHLVRRTASELVRGGHATRLDVPRLHPAEVGEMVRSIDKAASETVVQAIVARSGGVPFLVEELVAAGGSPGDPLPETLRDLLLAGAVTLAPSTRQAIAIASLVGRPADHELIAAGWQGSLDDLDAGLHEAVDRSILVVEPPEGRLAFRHALIGEAVAASVLPGERTRIHAALARALVDRPELGVATRAGVAAEIAHHLSEAHDVPLAIGASIRAGDEAAAARAYPEARAQYGRALALLDRLPDPSASGVDRIRLLDAAAECAFHDGDAERAVELGREALAAADAGPGAAGPERTAYLIGRLLEWAAVTRELQALTALGERALALVPADPPKVERALVLLSLASAKASSGRHRECLELARESADVARGCGAVGTEAGAWSMVAVALVGLGRDDDAVAAAERAVELAERSRGAAETAITRINEVAVHSTAGRFVQLEDRLAAAWRAVDREGLHAMSEAWLATDELDLLAWAGRWDDVIALASRIIEGHPAPSPLAWHLAGRGLILVRRGRFDEGERDLREVVELRAAIEPEVRARALAHLAEAAMLRDDPRAALARVREGLTLLDDTDEVPGRVRLFSHGLQAAADLLERAGARRDEGAAGEAVAAASPLRDRLEAALAGCLVQGGGTGGRVAAWATWGLAENDRRLGTGGTPSAWASAADALEGIGERYLAAWCRYREADAELAAGGDRGRATMLLAAIRAWCVDTGADPLRSRIEGLARRARLELSAREPTPSRAHASTPTDPYGLSQREREVLSLLVEGRTNREIGAALFITEKTASSHVTHILDKLGVASRGAAAALAARGGWLE
jgi:DNA-binding CsgD family transcriptional regulator/tetratricopeptide (TPR) repeat protein